MRNKKVKAIRKEARRQNEGENLSGGEMRTLKKLNKNNSIYNLKNGVLIMSEEELQVPVRPMSQLKHLTYLRRTKTVGILSKQLGR